MEAEYELMREAKRRGEIEGSIYLPENQTEHLAELREKMKVLQEQQKAFIVKDEFDQIYTEAGASGLNAGTMQDATFYFITVPSNKLELWFWMESERLLNPVFREFYSERDVVREERRMRVESNPTAKFEEQFDFMFWGSVPYHHPVVGWPSDVESITRAQAQRFFATYYAPNNITVAMVGDFDSEEALALAKKYFGRIPRGEDASPAGGDRGDRAADRAADDGQGRHQPVGPDSLAHCALRPQRFLRARRDGVDPLRPHRPALQIAGRGGADRHR